MEKTPLEKLQNKKIFSIEGNIGAGKTTLIKKLQALYSNLLLVEEPVDQWMNIAGKDLLKEKNNDMPRWGYSFECYVLITKMNVLLQAAESDKEMILIERCMLTDKAFFDVNVANGLCSPMEEAMFKRYYEFLNKVIYPKLSGIIYVDTPAEECIKRIQARGRKAESNIGVDYLNQLNQAFLKVVNESGAPTLFLDGTYDLKKDAEKINKQLKEFISNCINGNVS